MACAFCGNVVVRHTFVLYDRPFDVGQTVQFCSHMCFQSYGGHAVTYHKCGRCQRRVRSLSPEVHRARQWMYICGEQIDLVCQRCFEEHTLSTGQTLRLFSSALFVETPDAVFRWQAAGYVALMRQQVCMHLSHLAIGDSGPSGLFDQSKLREVDTDIRWDKWFLAISNDIMGDENGMHSTTTLYVRPRSFRREAIDAAVALMLCVKRMVRGGDLCGLSDVTRSIISKMVVESHLDLAWADVRVKRIKTDE